ncbi:hypothetical protein AT730_02605 [Vibrio alginolyticus]|nr:hypothetical protein AT730_02605 [Vibrio alginolyticus]
MLWKYLNAFITFFLIVNIFFFVPALLLSGDWQLFAFGIISASLSATLIFLHCIYPRLTKQNGAQKYE